MIIGVCRIVLSIPESFSLKDKRRVKRSIVEKVRNKFNVSIAEIEAQDNIRELILGISCISTDSNQIYRVLSDVIKLVEKEKDSFIVDYEINIL
ncbi:MAG: DUF503 domain-containing protein [Dictyoglomus sp.]|nr:DUF503 domain-containing protein [Dictyoglomus sp.]MCX7942213.1 DUF503 domain-containing protein [Dictyoglomaceae bacterium]MDW8188676.1 DUF503 domain-containing protein [Dictyoglomus sp.]